MSDLVERIRAIHWPDEGENPLEQRWDVCAACVQDWPCTSELAAQEIERLEARVAALEQALAAYREFVREAVSQGMVQTEMMHQRGIAILSDDPENKEWWQQLEDASLANPKSLLSQWHEIRAARRDGEEA